jgi:CheY-like chemotaxis protein
MNVNMPLRILIIEDNPGDAYMISELLRETGLDLNITVAEDGQKGLDLLKDASNNGSAAASPDFIVLDLNLPKVHGYEVLAFIRGSPLLRSKPVVVMTGSLDHDDELKSRRMGAAGYLIKPSDRGEMEATRQWLKKNLTPLVSNRQGNGQRPSANGARFLVPKRHGGCSPKLKPPLPGGPGQCGPWQGRSRL